MTGAARDSFILAVLLSIGVVMAGVQCHTALSRGLFHFDEAYYLLEAQTFKHGLKAVPDLLQKRLSLDALKKQLRDEGDLFPPSTAKPTFSLLLTFFSLLPIPLLAAGGLLSLSASIATAVVLFFCLQRLGLSRLLSTGVAVLFFVSPTYDYYAVTTLAQCTAGFFFMTALWLCVKERWAGMGLALGLCVTSHYGMVPAVGLLLFFTTVYLVSQCVKKEIHAARLFRMGLFFFLPALCWQLAYVGIYKAFGNHFQDMNFRTYFQQLQYQVFANAAPHLNGHTLHRNFFFFLVLARTEGLAISGVLVAAVMMLILRLRALSASARILLCTLLALTAFWLLNPGIIVSRIAVFILPLAYLILGLALSLLRSQGTRADWRYGVGLGLLIAISALRSSEIQPRLRSVYPEAAGYLSRIAYHGPVIDLWNTLIWQLYIPDRRMAFQQGEANNFSEFKQKMQTLLRIPEAHGRLAFFVLNQRLPPRMAEGLGATPFFTRLFAQEPAAHWDVPYSGTTLYRYEEGAPFSGEPAPHEFLNLYWISAQDFKP